MQNLLRTYCQTKLQISRRAFTRLVDDEQVFLNGKQIESYKQEIKNGDFLEIKDISYRYEEKISLSQEKQKLIIFNKPKDYVVSKADPHNKTVFDLLPAELQNYYYLGRLDKDSHGLLLLTNDPELVHERTHPSNGVEKEYRVEIDRKLSESDRKVCISGVQNEGEILKALSVKSEGRANSLKYKVILLEGKKRHIRRMFAALGYNVEDLQRVREGKIVLGDLRLGKRKEVIPRYPRAALCYID